MGRVGLSTSKGSTRSGFLPFILGIVNAPWHSRAALLTLQCLENFHWAHQCPWYFPPCGRLMPEETHGNREGDNYLTPFSFNFMPFSILPMTSSPFSVFIGYFKRPPTSTLLLLIVVVIVIVTANHLQCPY